MIGANTDYAGFWLRLAAYFVDGFILSCLIVVIVMVLLPNYPELYDLPKETREQYYPAFYLALSALYHMLFTASAAQATPGKMIVGIKVTTAGGGRVGLIRAAWRYISYAFSYATCGIGFLMAGITPQKRALHDYIAGTVVVQK